MLIPHLGIYTYKIITDVKVYYEYTVPWLIKDIVLNHRVSAARLFGHHVFQFLCTEIVSIILLMVSRGEKQRIPCVLPLGDAKCEIRETCALG